MKIVCISAARVPSDTANSIQVMKVCQGFRQLGHEVTLLVPGGKGAETERSELNKHYGLSEVFDIRWLTTRSRRWFPWRAAWLACQLKAEVLYAWPLQSAALGLLLGMPVLLELHDLPSGAFGPAWLTLVKCLPGRKRLLPITEALRRTLRLPASLSVIAPDGVDMERYRDLPDPAAARRQLGLAEKTTVLCTGHLYAGRGVELFLDLAQAFPQAGFTWVGGKQAEVEKWKAEASRRALSNLVFTGFVPNEVIPLYQAAANILLMPYQHTIATSSGGDTALFCSPMKMFEYMAAGRAIISSDLPVLREVLDDSIAVFCLPEDAGAWAAALEKLINNEDARQKLAEAARREAPKYTWQERSRRALEGFI